MDSLSVVVISCDKYQDLWDNFFGLKNKFWSDCEFPTYLGSNRAKYMKYDVHNISFGEDKSWAENVKEILMNVNSKYVIMLLEDFYIDRKIDQSRISELLNFAIENDVDCIRMEPVPGPVFVDNKMVGIGKIYPLSPYYINTQPSIWKRETLINLLHEGYSAWDFELKNSTMISSEKYTIYGTKKYVFHHANAVERGKYYSSVVKFLEKHELSLSEDRGIVDDLRLKYRLSLIRYRVLIKIRVIISYFRYKFKFK